MAITKGHYAVIFTRYRRAISEGYDEMADKMVALAKTMPGFKGVESAASDEGFGITISYWEDENAIAKWKQQADHLAAQKKGIGDWYEQYHVRVAKIERAYSGPKKGGK